MFIESLSLSHMGLPKPLFAVQLGTTGHIPSIKRGHISLEC